MAATEAGPSPVLDREDARKPPLSPIGLLLMNFGYFGIQFSFGLQQSAVNPIFTFIGAKPEELPLLNLAGPVTGLVIQPLIGALSDRTWSPRWGRRKPFFLIGAIGCSIMLFLFPFVGAIWVAFLFMWLLDASNNTAMEPYRAFISDRLPKNQLARGFLTQSMMIGMGAVGANLAILVFQRVVSGVTDNGIPYWVFVAFWIGAVASIGSVLVSVLTTDEIPPTEQELAELRAKPKGLGPFLADFGSAVREMPTGMHKIGLVFAFQWFALPIYWQFVGVSMTESVPAFASTDPAKPISDAAAGWVGAVNATYNLVTIFAAIALMPLAQRFGAKRVGAGALACGALGLIAFGNISNQYVLLLPMVGFGIAWASIVGIPYIMVASMAPKGRAGVYMGIVNMMIVVPMLIQNLTFGWIFEHLLGGHGTRAIMLAGVLFACAAIAMLWINPPPDDEESPLMPLGTHRHISVYNRVIVETDGRPAALEAVDRAHAVAAEANAQVVVISAYNPDPGPGGPTTGYEELRGAAAAESALESAVRYLTSDRVKRIEQRIVPGDPAQALLATADSPTDLIVVGNRGLDAAEGEVLGAVPAAVVKDAVCDVLIVQGVREVTHHRRGWLT